MSKEYLNGQDLKPEKKNGFESRKNTILLSVILVLVLAFITSVVIILLKSKNKNEEAPSESQSVVVTEQTNPHKTGGLPQAGGELPSIEMTQTTPVETCPICGSTDFSAPDGEGYKSCKKCDTKWKENGDKILVVQDGEKTEIHTTTITTTTTSHTSTASKTKIPILESIYVSFPPDYNFKSDNLENIDLSQMKVFAVYMDKSERELTADEYRVDFIDASTSFEQKVIVNVNYQFATCSFIVVKE